MSSLNVKYNNDKSRDFTNPTLPTGDGNDQLAGLGAGLGADILLLATQPRLTRDRLAGIFILCTLHYITLSFLFTCIL